MSEAKDVRDQKTEETGDDKGLLDELLFKQDLNEVHLLIDFVSGRADRSLSMLSIPDPEDPTKTMACGELMKAIAEMRYPPDGTKAVNARNAAILLMAKDRLSALATPANGLTIAYTRLFIEAEGKFFRRLLERWTQLPNPHHDIRIDLAQRSFPGLQAHARKFCAWREALIIFSLFWLFLTALAYWDAGLGRAALERLDQDWKIIVGETKDNPDVIRCNDPSVVKLGDDTAQKELTCRRFNYLTVVGQTAGVQVNDVFRCEGMGRSQLVHVWCWHWLLSGTAVGPDSPKYRQIANGPPGGLKSGPTTAGKPSPVPAADPQASASVPAADTGQAAAPANSAATPPEGPKQVLYYAKRNVAFWQTATSILSVFTAYVLPMMFALLGALIGAFRGILNRIGANELAPSDLVRMKVGIPTGLIAGFAVGLFLSPSSVPLQGEGGVAGQLTLTASGLGFLAGYASCSFFGFLDNVIRTVFPYGSRANAVVTRTASSPTSETQT